MLMLATLVASLGLMAAFLAWAGWIFSLFALVPTWLALTVLPAASTYLLLAWRACSTCSKRSWSRPFTEGFGL